MTFREALMEELIDSMISRKYNLSFEQDGTVLLNPKEEIEINVGSNKLKANVRSIVVNLEKSNIDCTINRKLTHKNLVTLLGISGQERFRGNIKYRIPLKHLNVTTLPEKLSEHITEFGIVDSKIGLIILNSKVSTGESTRHAEKPEDIDEIRVYDNSKTKIIEGFPYVKRINKFRSQTNELMFDLSKCPDLKQLEESGHALSENSLLCLTLSDVARRELEKVNPIYDGTISEIYLQVLEEGSGEDIFDIRYGLGAGKQSTIRMSTQFLNEIEGLEKNFEDIKY